MILAKPLARTLIGIAAVAMAAAGCGSDSDGGSNDTAGAQGQPEAQVAPGAVVGTMPVDRFGNVLVDTQGKAVYTNENESGSTIKCVDDCATFWPPLEATSDSVPASVEGVPGTFGVITRPDGSKQITLDDKPLYTFLEDKSPGMVRGDGFEDDFAGEHFVWRVVSTGGAAQQPNAPAPTTEDGGYGY